MWKMMDKSEKVITIVFLVAMVFACYCGWVKGTTDASRTYETIVTGQYY